MRRTGLTSVTNGFSIQWRGSVIAEETGEYEFILKTPNGVRLWVNDEETPLVDGSVASGTGNEPNAPIRLIGGRAYPLRLEYIKRPTTSRRRKTPRLPLFCNGSRRMGRNSPSPRATFRQRGRRRRLSSRHRSHRTTAAWATSAACLCRRRGTKPPPRPPVKWRTISSRTSTVFRTAKHPTPTAPRRWRRFAREFVEAAFRRPLTEEQKRLFVSAHFSERSEGGRRRQSRRAAGAEVAAFPVSRPEQFEAG